MTYFQIIPGHGNHMEQHVSDDEKETVESSDGKFDLCLSFTHIRGYSNVEECLLILSPFNDANLELLEENRVSSSKAIPILKMIDCMPQEIFLKSDNTLVKQLGEHLSQCKRKKTLLFIAL